MSERFAELEMLAMKNAPSCHLITKQASRSFNCDKVTLYFQDALKGLRRLDDSSFDLAIADPPYGASTKAIWKLEKNHAMPSFGGAWKLASHEWDMLNELKGFAPTISWLSELKRLVKPEGSIWIHSTYHNSGLVNVACQLLELEIINEVIWFKRNAFPNLSGRRLTASHETLLWIHTGGSKRKYRFNYKSAKELCFPEDSLKKRGKQLRTVWDIPNNKAKNELRFGSHPTQKPLRLTERMLLISGTPGGRLLVPFAGSGTEIIAGLKFDMRCIGFENDSKYFDMARRRIEAEMKNEESTLELKFATG